MFFKLNIAVTFFLSGHIARITATPLINVGPAQPKAENTLIQRAATYVYKDCPSFPSAGIALRLGPNQVFSELRLIDVGTSALWCTYEGSYTEGGPSEKVFVQTPNTAGYKGGPNNSPWTAQLEYQERLKRVRVRGSASDSEWPFKTRDWAAFTVQNDHYFRVVALPDPAAEDCKDEWGFIQMFAAKFIEMLAEELQVHIDVQKVNPRNFTFLKDKKTRAIQPQLLDCVPGVCKVHKRTDRLTGDYWGALSQAKVWWPLESKRVGLLRLKIQGLCPRSAQSKE